MTDKTMVPSEGGSRVGTAGTAESWYALSAGDVARRLGVDPASGIPAAKAAELLKSKRGSFRSQLIEERGQGRFVASRLRPHQPTGIMGRPRP